MTVGEAPSIALPKGRRKRRTRDAAATQRRLLAAAEVEFAAQGYQGARLRKIADRAQVQPALIHHYFNDKEGLYRAMLDAALGESSTLSWEILGSGGSLEVLIQRFVAMLLAFNEKHENLLAILRHEARAGSPAFDVTRQVVEAQVKPLLRAVGDYLEHLRVEGQVRRDCDVEEVTMMALALCAYPFVERAFLEACFPTRQIVDQASRERRAEQIAAAILRYAQPVALP